MECSFHIGERDDDLLFTRRGTVERDYSREEEGGEGAADGKRKKMKKF